MFPSAQHRPRRPGVHRPVRRGQCCALRLAQPRRRRRGRPGRGRAATWPRARSTDFAPGRRLRRHAPGARRTSCVEAGGADGRPQCDALVTDRPGRGADGPRRRLRAGPAGRPRGRRRRRRPRRAAGPGRRRRAAASSRMRELGADARSTAWIGPHVCGACYEVPAEMRDEVARVVPAGLRRRPRGAPRPSTSAPACAPSSTRRRRRRRRRRRAARASPPDLYSYRRDGAAAGRLAGLVRMRRDRRGRRAASEIAAGLATVRERIDAACAEAGRDPDEVTLVVVTKFFPAADVRLLADLGRARRRGEPPPGGARPRPRSAPTSTCGGTSWRPAEQQGGRRRRATPTSCTRSTAPSWSPGSAGAPRSAGDALDVLVQVDLDPPGRGGSRGRRPRRRTSARRAVAGTPGRCGWAG